MEKKEALRIFEITGALQKGHFRLSSGLHSPQYFQCALVLQYPDYLENFCWEIQDYFRELEDRIDVVISPAIGGIVVGQEVVRSIFAERVNDRMTLRRGFTIEPKENVLICEDVITTGGSVQQIIDLVEAAGAYPIGVGAVVDRSDGKVSFDVPLYSTVQVKSITYPPERCPLCGQHIPLVTPGSST